jgi:hypothetical protein
VSQHHHDHDHTDPPSDLDLRVKALQSLLIEKGLVDPAAIDILIDTYETKVGPRNGARVVARLERSSLQEVAFGGCHCCHRRYGLHRQAGRTY